MSEVPASKPAASVSYRLYKISGVAIASIFGSALAGGLLMSLNYRMLGQYRLARLVLILSFMMVAVAILIAIEIPQEWNVPNLVYFVPLDVAVILLAYWAQADLIKAHVREGGLIASNWKAFGIAILFLMFLSAVPRLLLAFV